MKESVKKILTEKILRAFEIAEDIDNAGLGLGPQIRLYRSGRVYIQLHTLTPENEKTKIRQLCKNLKTTFNKTVTSCGFLKYTAFVDGIELGVNTQSCFYGGSPIVEHKPRTKAYCPLVKEE